MLNSINIDGIELPVKACSSVYRKSESQNDFSFNVYTTEANKNEDKKTIFPIYLTDNMKTKHINVLLYYEETDEGCQKHYVLIKDFNRLFADINKSDKRKHFCLRCMHNFTTKELLQKT